MTIDTFDPTKQVYLCCILKIGQDKEDGRKKTRQSAVLTDSRALHAGGSARPEGCA